MVVRECWVEGEVEVARRSGLTLDESEDGDFEHGALDAAVGGDVDCGLRLGGRVVSCRERERERAARTFGAL